MESSLFHCVLLAFLFMLFFMGRYTVRDALEELEDLGRGLVSRVEGFLDKRDYDGVAGILVSLRYERVCVEREARVLRLKGELDREVYEALMRGYSELEARIWRIVEERGATSDVHLLYIMRLEALSKSDGRRL